MGAGRRGVWIAGAFAVVVFLVWLDQWSKEAAFAFLASGEADLIRDCHAGHSRHLVAGTWLSFMTSCNAGAAFGSFDGFSSALVAGRVIAVGVLAWFLFRADTGQKAVLTALTLVLAGAAGNVIDNLWTGCGNPEVPHGVRDFINVWFEPLFGWDAHFPSFNVADSCISVGAVVWILSGLLAPKDESSDLPAEEPAA